MTRWMHLLKSDPLPWLLADDTPAVQATALQLLLNRPAGDPEVARARAAAMESGPIAAILGAQRPEGYWEEPGPGYNPKYRGTVWQVTFLDQMGADGSDPRIRKACEYVLNRTQTTSGGFGVSYDQKAAAPPPSAVIHCLNGNLLRALIGFGWLGDERVQRAVEWQARSITGEGFQRYYQSGATGPGFCCGANEKLPCAWGAVKAMLALARIPVESRSGVVRRAMQQGAEFLLGRDPAVADYPFPSIAKRPSQSWFRLGFPLGYVTDVLQNMEALCELGYARDPRLHSALRWLLSKQDEEGRWKNEYAYNGKTWVDIDRQGEPSKWVTLRAYRALAMASDS